MIQNFNKKKKRKKEQAWPLLFYNYFFLLFGFLGGNLWGSFFSSFCLPPFFFVIGILLGLETLSYIYYKNISPTVYRKHAEQLKQNVQNSKKFCKNQFVFFNFLFFIKFTFSKKTKFTNSLYNSLNLQNRNKSLYLLKVGLVFGLFVDAFKVGS